MFYVLLILIKQVIRKLHGFSMDLLNIENKLKKELKSFWQKQNLEICGVQFVKSEYNSGLVLQITVQHCDHAPVNVQDLVMVNRAIRQLTEQSPLLDADYSVEIISAGLEKPISSLEDLYQAVGSYITLYLNSPGSELKPFNNIITGDLLSVNLDKQTFVILYRSKQQKKQYAGQYNQIQKAHYAIKI